MNAIWLLIIGVVLVIVAYYLPPTPPPIKTVCTVAGWICIAVGLILLIAFLIGVPLTLGAR